VKLLGLRQGRGYNTNFQEEKDEKNYDSGIDSVAACFFYAACRSHGVSVRRILADKALYE
jgi:hypothetical protein